LVRGRRKIVRELNLSPRHKDVLGVWKYSSTYSYPRHVFGVCLDSQQPHSSPKATNN